jgi:hypothetical protein
MLAHSQASSSTEPKHTLSTAPIYSNMRADERLGSQTAANFSTDDTKGESGLGNFFTPQGSAPSVSQSHVEVEVCNDLIDLDFGEVGSNQVTCLSFCETHTVVLFVSF